MTDPSGTTWYDYDKMGRVVMETKQINNLNYRTEYTHDLNGNVLTITYPGGRKITYTYNQSNKVTLVSETYLGVTRTLASNITYQPFGDITSMMYGNGIVTTKTYNNRYQLNNLTVGTLKQLSYSRDNAGNITAIADTLNPSKNKSYTYDNLYRLTLSTGSWGAITYAYDPVGNRTYETTDTGNTTYNYTLNTNKLTLTTGEKNLTFSYDNNGNTTSENTRQYIYNQNQRLTQVTDTGTVLGEYVYNGNGQRADKLIPSQNKCTVFHYDQNGLLITESTRTGNIKAEYVYLNGQPLVKIESNNIYYYHNDHLGTPMLMTDSSGSVVWQGEYLPFGEALSITGTITNNLRFPGQYYDSETGLHQNGFRDYKAEIGRYPEADPIGLLEGINLYIYVHSNPVNFVDPLGLFQSHWLLRALVPGQVAWDNALTAYEQGNYVNAGLNTGAMVGEQVLTVLTLGEGKAAQQCLAKAQQNIESNWFRYDPVGRWKTSGVWREGRHIHVDPIPGSNRLMKHHLPDQIQTWWGHFKAIIREWW